MGFLDKLFGKKQEVSPGGSTIYRYGELEDKGLRIPEHTGVYIEQVEKHFASLFPDRETRVLHEIVSDLVHIDVHVMWPKEGQDFFVLYTTGMSDLSMTIPDEVKPEHRKKLELAELYMFLPGDWPLSKEGMPPKEAYWPIGMLKFVARFPHEYKTWLGWGHTIPNGPKYAPLDDSVGFGAVVLVGGGDGPLGHIDLDDGKHLNLYSPIPAYQEEVEYKLKYGMEALDAVFQEKKLEMILNPQRPNLCADFKEVLDS